MVKQARQVPQAEKININFYNFNAEILATYIAAKNWEACWEYIISLMESFSIKMGVQNNYTMQKMMADKEGREYAEQFGGLMGELLLSILADPQTKISDKHYEELIFYHEVIHTFFYLRGVETTDDLIKSTLTGNAKLSKAQQKRLLLLLSMNTELDIVSLLKKQIDTSYKKMAIPAYMAYMKVVSPQIYKNKVRLYTLKKYLEGYNLSDMQMRVLMSAYFTSSYIDEEDKHSLKDNINKSLQLYFARYKGELKKLKAQQPQGIAVSVDENKPKLIVVLEIFRKGHAMRRSWGSWIKSLQSEFNVVLVNHEQNSDPTLFEDYNNVVTYKEMSDLIKIIYNFSPDMIVLPSVGMTFSGIATSNLRLAPIQLMALGHPATTRSKYIDYVYGQTHLYDERAFPTDTYIADDSPYKFIPNLTKKQFLSLKTNYREENPDAPLQVTIVGAEFKIIWPFLEVLKTIQDQSDFKIHFRFHLSSAGIDTLYVEQELAKHFKDYTFQGYQPYDDYLTSLAETDIVLNPFPFGHTNTIIDTLLLGKPCVSMLGIEPSSRTEKYILDVVGLSDKFLVNTKEEYISTFMQLAKEIMNGKTEFFDRGQVYDSLYNDENEEKIDFGKHLKWVYDNNDRIKASGKKMVAIYDDLDK